MKRKKGSKGKRAAKQRKKALRAPIEEAQRAAKRAEQAALKAQQAFEKAEKEALKASKAAQRALEIESGIETGSDSAELNDLLSKAEKKRVESAVNKKLIQKRVREEELKRLN